MRTRNVLYSYDIFLPIIDPFIFIIHPTLFMLFLLFFPQRRGWIGRILVSYMIFYVG